MQLADLLTDIHALEESILTFERKRGAARVILLGVGLL